MNIREHIVDMKDERNMSANLAPSIKKTPGRRKPVICSILRRLLKQEKLIGMCSKDGMLSSFKDCYCSVLAIPLKPGADYRSTDV